MAQMDITKWTTANIADDVKMEVKEELPNGDSGGGGKKANKRLSVERIYQKKTQLEHILLRPDTYIGTIERLEQEMWIYDEAEDRMKLEKIDFVPGLYKIFDEILVNAADNKQRDPKMNCIKIDVDGENNKIRIWNNGKGIPVVQHKTEKMYVPTMIFGHLLTSSNYDDSEKKVTGGRNGYGAKLCNIFSNKFTVETSCKEYGKHFKQSWADNMGKAGEPKIGPAKGDDFTCITFQPDLKRFGMESLEQGICSLFKRRAYDVAASVKGIKVFLNGTKLSVKGFEDYIKLFLKKEGSKGLESSKDMGLHFATPHDRWEIAVAPSEKGFQQMSFVNSIATTKGGRHVDHIVDQLTSKLVKIVEMKQNKKKTESKGGKKGDKKADKKTVTVKPFQVKNHLWVFVNCLIENPTFDSQTKENMTLQMKNFGSKCSLSEKYLDKLGKSDIVANINMWIEAKAKVELEKSGGGKNKRLRGLAKLDDANDAGGKNSHLCTLILTEGDSAKTLAVAGVSDVYKGRDRYGVFPLRGKLLNVRDVGNRMISANQEISDIVKIIGLDYKLKYDNEEELKKLRYGKLMIMTDQDQDGSHIKGLIINFIHTKWPGLLKHNFVEQFITPIVKVTKGKKKSKAFYSLPEFEEWRQSTKNSRLWKVRYLKGLGSSTNDEAKDYFQDMDRHKIGFSYQGSEDDASINLAFSKKKIEERKEWLTNWMEERKRRNMLGLPDLYLYNKGTKKVSFSEFVNRELILFSNMDNERSIPSLVDGFKPGQRKVMFVCFKRPNNKEVKVSQLSGAVSEQSAYHHGDVSLQMTIIGLASNFVGSNNLNLLLPIGQFGSRLKMGKDAASPRYISTKLSPLARLVFNPSDDMLLKYQFDDNKRVEPEWYCPIIPMVLVNGAEGIGTGWSTKVHNYDIREIVQNLLRMIDGDEPREMIPSWKDYRGTIEKIDETRYLNSGEVGVLDDDSLEITEIPIRMSTNQYKDILEFFLSGEKKDDGKKGKGKDKDKDSDDEGGEAEKGKAKKNKKEAALIKEYKNFCDVNSVKYVVTMDKTKLAKAEEEGLHKVFKLQTTLSTNSMVLFDADGVLKRYESATEILKEFFNIRLEFYEKRKIYMEGKLAAQCVALDNKVRFIMEKIEGIIVVENKKKAEVVQVLTRRGYDPDPVKAWEATQPNLQYKDDDDEEKEEGGAEEGRDEEKEEDDDEKEESRAAKKRLAVFDYLLHMTILSLTKEKRDRMLKDKSDKEDEMYRLQKTTIQDMWRKDLNELLENLYKVEDDERKTRAEQMEKKRKKGDGGEKGKGRAAKKFKDECQPTPNARRIEPRVDPALRLKAAATAKAKLKAQNKKDALSRELLSDIKMEIDDDDDPFNKSLTDRLGSLKTEPDVKQTIKQKKPRKPREPSNKKSPKKKKRNPWSDSDESDDDFSINEFSDSDEDVEPVIPKERTNRRGAVKKYTMDSDEDDDDDFGGGDDDNDDSFNLGNEANGRADGDNDNDWQNALSDDSDFGLTKSSQETKQSDSEPEQDLWSRITGKTAEKKTESARPASPIFGADSDDDRLLNDEPFEIEKPAAPAAGKKTLGKKPAAPKPKKGKLDEKQPSIFAAMSKAKDKEVAKKSKVNLISSDSDDDSDLEMTKTTKVTKTKTKKKAKTISDEDSQDIFCDKENNYFAANSQSTNYTSSNHAGKKNTKTVKSKTTKEPKPKAAPKRKKISQDSDSEEDKPKKKPAPKKKAAKKDMWDSDDSDGGFTSKPTKKKGKKAGSDSEDDFKPKKSKGKSKKKSADSDDSDLDLSLGPVAPREGGRARKAVTYNFGDDSEEDSDF